MQYMGGKAKIAKHILTAILTDTDERSLWFEPFVGGGNVMEHAAPHFKRCVGHDAHPDLILMWKAAVGGYWLPGEVTRERYYELKSSDPSPERGFAGFGASFGGKWWGGYGVSPRDGELWRQSARTVTRQAKVFSEYGVKFFRASFGEHRPPVGTVVYCDPPYAGTTRYTVGEFDYDHYYRTLMDWARTCRVYASEYEVPRWVRQEMLWAGTKRNVLDKGDNERTVTEKLFRIKP